jgi:nucleotide-binding universal stress UspA family protein
MTIVLGYDESPGAKRALEQAVEIAGRMNETLVVVYADAPPSRMGEEFTAHAAALAEQGHKALADATTRAQAAGVTVEVELVDERPAQALLDVADARDARLIVVGTYGESPLRSAILGSTPHKLLHWSTRPVLCVPPPAEAD